MKVMHKDEVTRSILKEHNHSWYEDIRERNKNNLSKIAFFFRGNKISYGEYFDLVEGKENDETSASYAKGLKQFGINKGDEFIAVLRQTPDYPILTSAASYTGSVINLMPPDLNEDYMVDMINHSSGKVVFINNWDFAKMANGLKRINPDKKIVIVPVEKYDKYNNPYSEVTDRFFKFDEEEFNKAVSEFDNVITIDDFLEESKKYKGEVCGHTKLSDPMTVTYTSGSTKKGFNKGVIQANSTYIWMGRYHDPEVCGIPPMKDTITYVAIGTQSDTTLMTGVSDTLVQGGTLALDPIIDPDYLLYCLKFTNAGLAVATTSSWIKAMKNYYRLPKEERFHLKGMYVPSSGGEALSAGEEKALNQWLMDVKAGTDITHTPMCVTKMTLGGGDTEHGSIFLTLFRAYYNALNKIRGIKEPMGMGYYDYCDVVALRPDGTHCEPMESGRLVVITPTLMKGYHPISHVNGNIFIKDAYGKEWTDLFTYGYIDKSKHVYVKGRIKENDPEIKPYQISDIISRDTKNVMSCETVHVPTEDGGYAYVVHIEPQFGKKVNIRKMLLSAERRCISELGLSIKDKLFFNIRTDYPLTFAYKRDVNALKLEGLTKSSISVEELENSSAPKKIEKPKIRTLK